MSHAPRRRSTPPPTHCAQTRLSEGALAAVDMCGCGMLRLHIGAITLRLAPCALSELAETLQQALLAHGQLAGQDGAASVFGQRSRERGEA